MSKIVLTFDNVNAMQQCSSLSNGVICETLGYHEKGDGGGARYTIESKGDAVANKMDIVAIGDTENYTLVARFMNEGKPVNVLQFGAVNDYDYSDNIEDFKTNRNASKEIQRAIDYTEELLYMSNGSNYRDIL